MRRYRKIVVVMTYFNRERQLLRTLESIALSAHPYYHIVIVDDASEPTLPQQPSTEIIRIEKDQKLWTCPVVPYNMGIARALHYEPDIIVLQNAECYHVGDVLTHANNHVTGGNYVTFAAWGEYEETEDSLVDIANDDPHRTDGGSTGWYNHPKWRARAFHFCNAYPADTLRALNGFDERFKDGAGRDDDDLVQRTKKLKIARVFTDESQPFVVHQWHDRDHLNEEMYQRNQVVWNAIAGESGYKAQHIITEDFS